MRLERHLARWVLLAVVGLGVLASTEGVAQAPVVHSGSDLDWTRDRTCLSDEEASLVHAQHALLEEIEAEDAELARWLRETLSTTRLLVLACRAGAAPRGHTTPGIGADAVASALETTRATSQCREERTRLERIESRTRDTRGATPAAWEGLRRRAEETLVACHRASATPTGTLAARVSPASGRGVLSAVHERLRACHVAHAPSADGTVRLTFRGGATVTLARARVGSTSIPRVLLECVVSELERTTWPYGVGQTFTVVLRLRPPATADRGHPRRRRPRR